MGAGNSGQDPPGCGGAIWRAGAAQPVTVLGREKAGHSARQAPVVAENGHQRSLHAQDDPLPGQLKADADLSGCPPVS
jgi:hypothetical protein